MASRAVISNTHYHALPYQCNSLVHLVTRGYFFFVVALLIQEIVIVVLSTRKTIMDGLQVCATAIWVLLHFVFLQRAALLTFLLYVSLELMHRGKLAEAKMHAVNPAPRYFQVHRLSAHSVTHIYIFTYLLISDELQHF